MAFVSSALSCNGIQRVEFRPVETTCGLVPRAGSSAAPQRTFESGRSFSLKSSFLGNNNFSFSTEAAVNHADAFDFSSILAEVSTDPSIVIEKLGPDTRNKTWYPKAQDVDKNTKKWYVIDAEGQRLGRLATHIATVLRGKNKPTFTPSADTGDYVIVVNAEKIAVTGKKELQKTYFRHSGRPGGGKSETLRDLRARIPERILEKAVWGMLPKNSLGREVFRHLKVVAGPDHQYQAQQPEKMEVNTIPKPNSTRITSIW